MEVYFQPYGPQDLHSVESNTKSVIGALFGIAIEQGLIENVDQRVLDFFPGRHIENVDRRKEAMTLEHLLSLTAGLDCQDNTPPANGMYGTQGWVQFLLDLPMAEIPGSQWRYCSGAVHLLSSILQKTSGMDARSFANRYLFEPLGIPAVVEAAWPVDPQGYSIGIAGLHLTPRDLAKFGYLYLHQGQWDGRQVVPAKWVETSTREHAYIGKDEYAGGQDRRFGYLFSLFPQEGYYGYLGMAGQETWVIPGQNMVVVFTAGLPVGQEADLLKLLNGYILPAVRSAEPLPENVTAQSRLAGLVQQAAGVRQETPKLPQAALDIMGKTFHLDENPFGWQEMTFGFEEGSGEAALTARIYDENYPLTIGLDGLYRVSSLQGNPSAALLGRWRTPEEFVMKYVTMGEYSETEIVVRFAGDQIECSVTGLNFPGEPTLVRGSAR
jgi:CubicO group peptidase (beta-lactamase class C family)